MSPRGGGDQHGDAALEALQVRCRKDPEAYVSDYQREVLRFSALLKAAVLSPTEPSGALEHAAQFVSGLAGLYPKAAVEPANAMVEALASTGVAMHHRTRRAVVRAVAMMRAKGVLAPMPVLKVFMDLLQCKDKALRKDLIGQVLSDLRRPADEPTKRQLQAAVFATFHISDASIADDSHTKRILLVVIDLFRERIWHDSRTANVIAENAFHPSPAIMVLASKFLVGEHDADESDDESESEDEDESAVGAKTRRSNGDGSVRARELWIAYHKSSRKSTRKRMRLERQVSKLNRRGRTRARISSSRAGNSSLDSSPFAALMMINDPQEFVERLFSDLQKRRKNESFETRLALLNLITRIVGAHELLLLNLYPFLQRYLRPHQTQVTLVLAYMVQACHPLVPPDALHPVVRALADFFVSDRCSGESVAAGINAIRAICSRIPLAIQNPDEENSTEEAAAALLQDLVDYKSSKDKGISIAARSLQQLYREVNPILLKKRDRGKEGAGLAREGVTNDALRYGHVELSRGVPGVQWLDEDSNSDVSSDNGEEALELEESEKDTEDDEDASSGVEGEGSSDGTAEEGSGEECDAPSLIKPQPSIDKYRILSDSDFRRIREKQAAADLERTVGSRNRVDTSKAFDPAEIESYQVHKKRTLEERLETVRAGREGRESFGSKKGRKEKTGGKSNQEKRKTKANSMMLHKMKRKRINESMKQKQARIVKQRKGKRHKK